jgi:CRP-like cAMP-binding protein
VEKSTQSPGIGAVSRYLIRKLGHFYEVTPEIEQSIVEATVDSVEFTVGHTIIRGGDRYSFIYLMEEGWVLRERILPEGQRQIVNIALPGEFLCFNAALFQTSEFDLVARTPVRAFKLSAMAFSEMLKDHPYLALALAWANAHEEALLAERVVSLGRRSARERLAHILCEISARLKIIGLGEGDRLAMPLVQEDFADILGLSVIHVHRMVRRLVAEQVIAYQPGQVRVLDMGRLERIAGFDDGYLHFTLRPDFVRRVVREAE